MTPDRLAEQIAFLKEIDRLKSILRRTSLIDRSRQENSAEHSWHLGVMALVLADQAPEGTDIAHAVRLLLVHDLVEIDAGDTFAFDRAANADKHERERAAADRIFSLLPPDMTASVRGWWEEFEEGASLEARFANALDRFSGLLQNWAGQDGGTWRQHGIGRDAVLARMHPIRGGAPGLWPTVVKVVEEAVAAGHVSGQSC